MAILIILVLAIILNTGIVYANPIKYIIENEIDVYFENTYDCKDINVFGKNYPNVWQYSLSDNKRALVIIKKEDDGYNLIINSLGNNSKSQEEKFADMIYCPSINDNKDVAYVKYDGKNNKSTLMLNREQIDSSNQIIYNTLDNKYLYYVKLENRIAKAFKIELATTKIERIVFPQELRITRIARLDTKKAIIEAFSMNSNLSKIFVYDFAKLSVEELKINDNYKTMIITNKNYDGFTVSCYKDYSSLIYSYINLLKYAKSMSMSKKDNSQGSFTWNLAYRIEGLIEAYKKTKLVVLKEFINQIATNLLNKQNCNIGIKNKYTYPEGWATTAYSLDKKTYINLLVDDARIIYSLLVMVNNNIVSKSMKDKIVECATKTYDFYEKDYVKSGKYIASKGMKYSFDGVCLPWNQQNAFGLCCIELYKITKNEKYKKRAKELAIAFKQEFITEDNCLVWCYWPLEFYKGWNDKDNICVNTPKRKKTNPALEDIGHAGLNVKFILEFQKEFPNEVFNGNHLIAINNTAKKLYTKNGFYSNMYIKELPRENSYKNLPSYGWPDISDGLDSCLSKYIEKNLMYNDFERTILYLFNKSKNTDVVELIYSNNLKFTKR